jgi:hypothetical protein
MSSTIVHPNSDTLREFVLGELSHEKSKLIEQHIVDCDVCCEQLGKVGDDDFVGLVQSRNTTQHSSGLDTDGLGPLSLDSQ